MPQDKPPPNKSHAVIVPIEVADLVDGLIDAVCQLDEVEIFGRNEAVAL